MIEEKNNNKFVPFIPEPKFTKHPNYKQNNEYNIYYRTLDKNKKVISEYGRCACFSGIREVYNNKIAFIEVDVPISKVLIPVSEMKEYIRNLNKMGIFNYIYCTFSKDATNYKIRVKNDIFENVNSNYQSYAVRNKRLATLSAVRYLFEKNSHDFRTIPYYFNYIMKYYEGKISIFQAFRLAHHTTNHNWGGSGHAICYSTYSEFKTPEEISKGLITSSSTFQSIYLKQGKSLNKFSTFKELHTIITNLNV